ncbi:sporulation protein [Brevibacillus humidisoli]|uniref:sporulation protein n=1 Tax=Brevibacillus humidisoli TaxID=2895522 RepID=UPI001E2F7241|nr:sporulation protein [Brevibacillus humidisoli]UFJ40194.1 sporulation protein [Brevibacillus humidisoli]
MQAKVRWSRLGGVLLVLALVTGCNSPTTPQENSAGVRSLDPTQNGQTIPDRNDDVIDRQASPLQDRDELMGRDQNPNLVIGHSNVNNKEIDIRNMRMMARRVPGVENARITLNGGNAYITLDLVPNVTAQQARDVERQVITALRQKVPRYDFHVTSNDGYHR